MLDARTLKRQHEEIYSAINLLKASINTGSLEDVAIEIAQKINVLAGILKIHLGTEDRYMYPYLLQSGDDELKIIAKDYVDEMGGISDAFTVYKNRFNTRSKILSDTKGLVSESKRIISVLEDRVMKEDMNLYLKFD